MTAIPSAALAVMKAAAEDYRLTTPPEQTTPAALAERVAEYLVSEGYAVRPAVPLYARLRAAITARVRFRHRGDRQLLRLIRHTDRRTAR